jgi:hypothetical protein
MKKITQKRFEKLLLNFYPELEITPEEKNELYGLYSQIKSIGDNLLICSNSIKDLIFVHEQIYDDNVDYVQSFNIDYSTRIFSNELMRKYSFKLLSHILIFAMSDLKYESMVFFENKNPELWAKRMGFYQSKLKKVCIENSYIPMKELLDKLFRILVTLNYDLKAHYSDFISHMTRHYTLEEITLFSNVYNDKDGNYDGNIWLSDYFFSSKDADKVIADYELSIKQKEEKKLSKKKSISIHTGS